MHGPQNTIFNPYLMIIYFPQIILIARSSSFILHFNTKFCRKWRMFLREYKEQQYGQYSAANSTCPKSTSHNLKGLYSPRSIGPTIAASFSNLQRSAVEVILGDKRVLSSHKIRGHTTFFVWQIHCRHVHQRGWKSLNYKTLVSGESVFLFTRTTTLFNLKWNWKKHIPILHREEVLNC